MPGQEWTEGWAILELMGHQMIAGYLSEHSQFGTTLARVDVPDTGTGNGGFTKFFGGAAIYGITPTTEEIATFVATSLDVRPVSEWVVPLPRKAPTTVPGLLRASEEDWEDED